MNLIARRLLGGIMWLFGCCASPICRIVSGRKTDRCPKISSDLLLISATKLAEKIRNQEIACVDVIAAYINRCKEVNPILNAIVEDRFEAALIEAKETDKYIQSNQKTIEELKSEKPLLGVPITVKESISVQGMSNNAGRYRSIPKVAEQDADAVKRVCDAGAIILLVSNTPELCMLWETYNKVHGTTKNPYDIRRTPAGSSGGESALLGSAASLLSLSSDIGGSCRLPAMFSGVFGHKPTPRSVSTAGHVPNCNSPNWGDYFTIAPMTRYAEDLPLLLNVINHPDGPKLTLFKEISLSTIKVYYMEDDNNSGLTVRVDPEIKSAMQRAILHLRSQYGIQAKKVNIKAMKHSFEMSTTVLFNIEGVESIYSKEENIEEWGSVWPEMMKYITGTSKSILSTVLYGPMKKVVKALPDSRYKRMYMKNEALRNEFQTLLGSDGVFIYPTFPTVAHYHYEIYHKILNCSYMMIFNSLMMPVTACTLGLNSEGLPMGMQIATNPGQDHLSIALAKEIEKGLGGWIPPQFKTD